MSNDYTKDTVNHASPVPCDELRLDHPPRGIKMERTHDGATVIKVRMFSLLAFGDLAAALFCNFIVSTFVCHAISVTAARFGYDAQLMSGDWNDGSKPPWWFLWLILTPFIVIGFWLIYRTVFSFFGKVEVLLGPGEGSVFKGFGRFGRTQRFFPQAVKSVDWNQARIVFNNQNYPLTIEMNNAREIKFPFLGKMRETWLDFALNKILGLE